jgi:hypothetical protein
MDTDISDEYSPFIFRLKCVGTLIGIVICKGYGTVGHETQGEGVKREA